MILFAPVAPGRKHPASANCPHWCCAVGSIGGVILVPARSESDCRIVVVLCRTLRCAIDIHIVAFISDVAHSGRAFVVAATTAATTATAHSGHGCNAEEGCERRQTHACPGSRGRPARAIPTAGISPPGAVCAIAITVSAITTPVIEVINVVVIE